jgi:hypothetical protein
MPSLFLHDLAEHQALMTALPALDDTVTEAGRRLASLI